MPAAPPAKKKPAAVAKKAQLDLVPNPATPAGRAALIDEYGRLDARIAELKPVSKRHEELRRILLGWYEDEDGTATYEPAGADYVLTVGPRAERRSVVDMRAVVDRIGLDAFLPLISISFEKLDSVILPEDQVEFVRKAPTGPRQLRVTAKANIGTQA